MDNKGVCVSTKTAVVLGAIFVAMIVFGIISRNKNAEYAKRMDNYIEHVVKPTQAYADSMARKADSSKAVADSLIKVTEVQRANIKKLSGDVAVLHIKNKKLADAALADTNTPPAARAAIIGLQNEVDSLNLVIVGYDQLDKDNKLAIANLTSGFNDQKHRADSLDIIVKGIPKPPGPATVIGIKMPHIPTWVGYVAVAAGSYYVGTQVNK